MTVYEEVRVLRKEVQRLCDENHKLKKENEKLKEGLYNKDVLKMKNRKDIIVANVQEKIMKWFISVALGIVVTLVLFTALSLLWTVEWQIGLSLGLGQVFYFFVSLFGITQLS